MRKTRKMTEKQLREKAVEVARSYLGAKQGSAEHKEIVDTFNKIKPDGGAMNYTGAWCAVFASADAILAFGEENAIKYFPLSWNCGTIINKAKQMKIFVENDAYVPREGDWILYDWEDSGKGDNVGSPNHVGIVEKVKNGIITIIEGNFSTQHKVGERDVYVNGKYIRGFVTPKYSAMATTEKKKTVEEIAKEVIDGKWGTGDDRKKKLVDAGYDYKHVQDKVNEILAKKKKPTPMNQKIVNLARKQIGNGYRKYCKAFGKTTSWCQIFLWWLFDDEGMKILKTSFARKFAEYCKKHWKHIRVSEAQKGDVVFFVAGHNGHNRLKHKVVHVGMIRAKSKQATKGEHKGEWYVYTIEGNVGVAGQWKTNIVDKRKRNVNRVWGIFRTPFDKLMK